VSATAAQRATAARALRRGASESQAARKAKVNKRTIQRWKKDPSFAARLHSATRITLGHLPEPDAAAPSSDLLDGLSPSRAWISVADLDVLGSALHPLANTGITNNCDPDSGKQGKFTSEVAASVVFVELVETPERVGAVRDALAAEELPDDEPAALVVPLTVAGLLHVQGNPEDLEFLISAASDFRAFLDVWRFTNQEHGQIRVLGEVLWPAQEEFVRVTAAPEAEDGRTGKNWLYVLKARKLGETTIACAYDAWVLRFRDQNARVHLFSRREDAARELLQALKFGLERLPAWLQLPVSRSTAELYELRAGLDDRRLAKAYPADKETAVENSCTHGHVDEWARMADPRKVWQAIEPTMAGSCHMVTTGLGPTNFTSKHWRRCLAGDARHHPCFIGALARPDRTPAWLKSQRAGMDEQQFRQEYPSTWQEALSGGGDYVFRAHDLDGCSRDFYPPGPAQPGHKYVKAWDIGRHQDAAVGLVLDVTEDVHDVIAYRRLRGVSYPEIQREIETMHKAYPGISVIEDNAAGEAVRENLDLPQHQVLGFRMTASSKARIIEQLKIAVQGWVIKWDAEALSQLDSEMRGYQLPDDNVEQDSVIALAIALEHAPHAHPGGRILAVIKV
jgi:Terminase RNaseH-like domain/Homeodomain-like domain